MDPSACLADEVDPPTRPRVGLTILLLLLATGLAQAIRLARLATNPEPLGTDGYYYVVQVTDLLALGRLHVPDASWVFWWLAGWSRLVGEPVLAIKLGAACLAAACTPLAWWAGRAIGRRRGLEPAASICVPPAAGAAWALACWAAASPSLTQLAADFPKNLGLVAPGLALLAVLLGRPRGLTGWLAAAALALLVAWAHRLGAGLLLAAALGAGLGWLLGPARRRRVRGRDWLALGVLGGALFGFVTASLSLPGLLHPADLERLAGQFDLSLANPAPFAWFALRPTHPIQQIELIWPWAALGLSIWAWFVRPDLRPLLGGLGLPLAICLLPFWRRDELDLGYRLGLMGPLLAAPLTLLAAPAWIARPCRRWFGLALAAGLVLIPLARHGIDPADTPPYGRYRKLVARIPRPLPELLIAHQGINFLYDHLTGREAMAWAPEARLDRRAIGRLAWGVRDGEWLACADPDPDPEAAAVVRLDADYVYVREDQWERLQACARGQADDDLLERLADWRNPTQRRSAGLLRERNPQGPGN